MSEPIKQKINSTKDQTLHYITENDLEIDTYNDRTIKCFDMNDIPLKRHLQIVIMADSSGAFLLKEEMLKIQDVLIHEIEGIAEHQYCAELKFHSSMVLQTGWMLLNCHDEPTFQWVFDWSAASGQGFTVVKASEAPWKPARIYLKIDEMSIDINSVLKILVNQNSNLKLNAWKYIGTHMMDGYWYLHFLVSGDGVWLLEDSCWKVHFILEMISVYVVDI